MLFRRYYALPSTKDVDDHEVAAVRGVLASVLGIVRNCSTYCRCHHHVIEYNGRSRAQSGTGLVPSQVAV